MQSVKRFFAKHLGAIAGCLFLAFASSSIAQNVNIDYDHSYPFNKIKSYTYGKVGSSDATLQPRITAAIDRDLQGQGLHLVSKNPDVIVSIADFKGDAGQYATFYQGMDGYTWKRGWGNGGFSQTDSSLGQIAPGTLVVDMYAADSKKLIWRAVAAQAPVSKEKKATDNVDKSVNTMFGKFPPKSGGPVAPNQVEVPASPSSETVTGTR